MYQLVPTLPAKETQTSQSQFNSNLPLFPFLAILAPDLHSAIQGKKSVCMSPGRAEELLSLSLFQGFHSLTHADRTFSDSSLLTSSLRCKRSSTTEKNTDPTIPYLPFLHNHFSNPSVSSSFGTSPLAVFHLLETSKFLCPAGLSIKFLNSRVSGLYSPSQITLDLYPLSAKTLARA